MTATFQGGDAGFSSTLFLQNSDKNLFKNIGTSTGTTLNLGTFDAGTELIFGLSVQETSEVFFTGVGSRNADGLAHAWLDESFGAEGEALVGLRIFWEGAMKTTMTFYFRSPMLQLKRQLPL